MGSSGDVPNVGEIVEIDDKDDPDEIPSVLVNGDKEKEEDKDYDDDNLEKRNDNDAKDGVYVPSDKPSDDEDEEVPHN